MGYEARCNPRSMQGGTSERSALDAQFRRFVDFFGSRGEYEQYLSERQVTDIERQYLDSLLPTRLQGMD